MHTSKCPFYKLDRLQGENGGGIMGWHDLRGHEADIRVTLLFTSSGVPGAGAITVFRRIFDRATGQEVNAEILAVVLAAAITAGENRIDVGVVPRGGIGVDVQSTLTSVNITQARILATESVQATRSVR